MKGYVTDIEAATRENQDFRRVLYTSHYMQLVLMSIPVGGEIGEEVHGVDQFLRIESGQGKAVLNGTEHPLQDGSIIVVPASVTHNIINVGDEPLQLYTLYAPPHHADQTVHATREIAEADHEEFMGDTTE